MEKEQSLNKKRIYVVLSYCVFITLLFSCKQGSDFVYNDNSIIIDPLEKTIKNRKIRAIEIFKVDSLGGLDSMSLRKYYFSPNGLIEMLEDKPPFSTTLKIKYEDANIPSSLYCLSDYALQYSSITKIDSNSKKISTFWKDEFKNIEDSTIYFFNKQNQLVKVNNGIDLFNNFIRKKIGNGVFKIHFDLDLKYNNDSVLIEKKITYKSKNNEYKDIIPKNSISKYKYDKTKNLTKSDESYSFEDKTKIFIKEVFYKNGLPEYHLLNGNKYIYKYIYYTQ